MMEGVSSGFATVYRFGTNEKVVDVQVMPPWPHGTGGRLSPLHPDTYLTHVLTAEEKYTLELRSGERFAIQIKDFPVPCPSARPNPKHIDFWVISDPPQPQ